MKIKIRIIGSGKMGSAIARSLRSRFDVHSAGRDADLNEFVTDADIVIFAVKPQDFSNINLDLSSKLVISIMAGVSIAKLAQQTKANRIIRSMPNLPLQVEKGMTAWCKTASVSYPVQKLFECFGDAIEVQESEMDAITAVSGSGPAYFFKLCEALEESARSLGFSYENARILAEKTFIGTAKLLEENELSAAEWREAVTSKGGTTEAALKVLDFNENLDAAVQAAQAQSVKLNNES